MAGEIRNHPCICGSGKKIKKCCGVDRAVPSELAQEMKDIVASQHETLNRELAAHSSPIPGEENGEVSGRP